MSMASLSQGLPDNTTLIAVSKTFPSYAVEQKYALNQRDFAENRVQELLQKQDELKHLEIRWHLIGPLQKNKVNKVVGRVYLFHALDSIELYEKISEACIKFSVSQPCLLQVNISKEDGKSGIIPEEVPAVLNYIRESKKASCPIWGLMCIGSDISVAGETVVRDEFSQMQKLYSEAKNRDGELVLMRYLSMGMSMDYRIALEYGSNMIRLGRAFFGDRG